MLYIIDANNLAGKLKMLGEKDFDRKLIQIFIEYLKIKDKEIELVFDGVDSVGDRKIVNDRLTVVFAPKDEFYDSADDKIVEMVERIVNREDKDITVVTDDAGLKKRIEEISARFGKKIEFERATWWAGKLIVKTEAEEAEEKELSREEVKSINQELLNFFKK
jgi:predicted RNA-binding protein with PIN domain